MKNTAIIAAAILVSALVALITAPIAAGLVKTDHIPDAGKMVMQPTERQELWISALEWCESRGVETAVNPKDRDGTPSYGAFQFKPSTYSALAIVYDMASTTDYMNADEQRAIVERMVLDPTTVWEQQFPDCVKRVIGRPPQS